MHTILARLRSRRSTTVLFILVAALSLALGFAQRSTAVPAPTTVTPLTWDVIGLDSNKVSDGPDSFPVGARLCNDSGSTINSVSTTFTWGSNNSYVDLSSPGNIALGNLVTGSCVDAYFTVTVTRSAAAYFTARRYQISFVGNGGAFTQSTPANRQLYVEKLVSQNRNQIDSVTPSANTVTVGDTLTVTVNAHSSTTFGQIEAFPSMSGGAFRIISATSTYSEVDGGALGAVDTMYNDACGWITDTDNPNYRSCAGSGKAGKNVVVVYTLKAVAPGTITISPLITDYSSSYHYNSDFGTVSTQATVVVEPPNDPDLAVSKSHVADHFIPGSTGNTYTLIVSNQGTVATSSTVTLVDAAPTGLTVTGATFATEGNPSGWNCAAPDTEMNTVTCTTDAILVPGDSYDPIIVTVDVANVTGTLTNVAEVSNVEDPNPDNNVATDGTIVGKIDLEMTKSHTGNFTAGQTGAKYKLSVKNAGTVDATGLVTVTDVVPAGLTVTDAAGTDSEFTDDSDPPITTPVPSVWECGWVGNNVTCTTAIGLAAGASYDDIVITVDVDDDAGSPISNAATVTGGGDEDPTNNTDTDETTIDHVDLRLLKSHSGNFTQGQVGATYTISVSNIGTASTDGTEITVTDTLPAGLTATDADGTADPTAWDCEIVANVVTCTTSDVLAASASYDDILITVNVSATATSVTNSATVSGGGDVSPGNNTDDDYTNIVRRYTLNVIIRGSGSVGSSPGGINCGTDCTNTYLSGTKVRLNFRPSSNYYVVDTDGCYDVTAAHCDVTMSGDRTVVVRFAQKLVINLELPDRLVYHEIYDRASMYARVTWKGRALDGAAVRLRFNCGGSDDRVRTRTTNSSGNATFVEGRSMRNELRLLECDVTASVRHDGISVRKTGTVRFIHPYWLKVTSSAAGDVRIAAFGRAGHRVLVKLRGSTVARGTLGSDGWLTLRVPGARRGDTIYLAGADDDHRSHGVRVG